MVAILVAYLYVSCAANYPAFPLTFNDKFLGVKVFMFLLITLLHMVEVNIVNLLIKMNLMTFLFVGF